MKNLLLTTLLCLCTLAAWADVSAGVSDVTDVIEITSGNALETALWVIPDDGTETTLRLMEDVETGWLTVFYNRNVVLDLNGKTLTINGCIEIIRDASLRVTGNGTIIETAQNNTFYNHGSLTIDNGTFRFQNESWLLPQRLNASGGCRQEKQWRGGTARHPLRRR